MGAIHRTLSSLSGALPHCSDSAGTDSGIGRSERTVFLSASVGRLRAWPCNGQRRRGGNLGWCLARSGGYSGPLVIQHMWGGVSLAAVSWLCWMLRARASPSNSGLLYAIALAIAVALVAWTGYRGGQLSQGEDHLTEYMPVTLRQLLGYRKPVRSLQSMAAGQHVLWRADSTPIFADRCITCHGPDKHKSNLRLDSYDSLMRGAKHGPVVRAGNIQGSELFRRITLSPDHDDFMPKAAKRPSVGRPGEDDRAVDCGRRFRHAADGCHQ